MKAVKQMLRTWLLSTANPQRPRGYTTTFQGLDAFRQYVNGRITLQQFRDADCSTVTKSINDEETKR